jgi:hypothetical protein
VILYYRVITLQVYQFCSDLRTVIVSGTGQPTAFGQTQLYNILSNTMLTGQLFVCQCTVILHYRVITMQVHQFYSDLRMVFVGGTGRPTAFRHTLLHNIMSDNYLLS